MSILELLGAPLTHSLVTIALVLAAIGFIASRAGLFFRQEWGVRR